MLTRRRTLGLLTIAPAAATLLPSAALARESEVFQNPVAINAIDPVAYFEQQKPVPGQAEHARRWNGAEWHFANENNANTFAANPEAFASVFGGYCAFAASRGYLAQRSPKPGPSMRESST
ncbi:YHS domain-containing (seleno)protein [Paramylibacter kogurei]|uniref:YHS domain-containing (seleno)protein n=1 Tax=Paramylibacter kogurei TaxID=1889778 RepID=UPI001F0A7BF2|nr:YHS domain-containing (seleno)protein [Amylibacter kogurei]